MSRRLRLLVLVPLVAMPLAGCRDPLDAIQSDHHAVRGDAVSQLARHATDADIEQLRRLAREHPKPKVRAACTGVLGYAKARQAVPTLIQALDDGHWMVERAAIDALGSIGDPRAGEPLLRKLAGPNPELRRHAATAFQQVGYAPAVPALLDKLRMTNPTRDSGVDDLNREVLGALGFQGNPRALPLLTRMVSQGDEAFRYGAAHAMVRIDPRALITLLELQARADEPLLRHVPMERWMPRSAHPTLAALAWMLQHDRATPCVLAEALGHDDHRVRAYAAALMVAVGGRLQSDPLLRPAWKEHCLPALNKALRDPAGLVRITAAITLWQTRRDPPLAGVLVRQALRDAHMLRGEDPWLRRDIAWELVQADPRSPETLGLLLAELEQRPHDAQWVFEGLAAIGRGAVPALLGLIEASQTHRDAAAAALAGMPSMGCADFERLRSLASSEEAATRAAARRVLEAFDQRLQRTLANLRAADYGASDDLAALGGPAAPAARAILRDRTEEARLRWSATEALGRIASRDADAVGIVLPDLVAALDDPERDVRVQAAYAIQCIGPPACDAAPALLRKMLELNYQPHVQPREGDSTGECRCYAGALVAMGGAAAPAVSQALRGDAAHLRIAAAAVLGKMGRQGESSVPQLIQALSDRDHYLRAAAAQALGAIGAPADAIVPALAEAFRNDRVSFVAVGAADALTRLAKAAVPTLADALANDRRQYRRYLAATALGRIGREASDAVGALETARDDPDYLVREAAAKALESIRGERAEKGSR